MSNKPSTNVRVDGYFGTANKASNIGASLGEMMVKRDSNLDVGNSRSNMVYNSAGPKSGYQSEDQPFVQDLFGST